MGRWVRKQGKREKGESGIRVNVGMSEGMDGKMKL